MCVVPGYFCELICFRSYVQTFFDSWSLLCVGPVGKTNGAHDKYPGGAAP